MIDQSTLTITKAHRHLKSGDFSARELAECYLERIKERDTDVHAYLEVFEDVLFQADEVDKRLKDAAPVHPLAGIPLAMKDNILIEGRVASAASKMLEEYSASYDATATRKLKEAGAVFLGRTNMDEFAMGSSTENSAYGVTSNPHDTSRVPGGSSGGSAAAIAMGGALAGVGSDTGGSVRQPASFCGVVGLKPTYGAISRSGLIAMGSSLDQIGPLAKTVEDVEILFNTLRGEDSLDSTSLPDMLYTQQKEVREKLVVGIPTHFLSEGVDEDVRKNFEQAVATMQHLGHSIQEITLPNIQYSLAVYYVVMPAEVSSNLARFDGVRYGLHKEGEGFSGDYEMTRSAGFGAEVRRRIILGTHILSSGYYDAYYTKAQAVRNIITDDFARAFDGKDGGVDVIMTPTTPTPAFVIGEKIDDPLKMYLADMFTVPANIAGIPALSIPSGTAVRGDKELPLGVQFMASHMRENILFQAGKSFMGE